MKINLMIVILVFAILSITYNSSFCHEIHLNQYGHIDENCYQREKGNAQFFIDGGQDFIKVDGKLLRGNSLFYVSIGYVTLTTLEENVPTIFRFYNKNGQLLFEETFRRIINIDFSENREFVAFFDGKSLNVFSVKSQTIQKIACASHIFSVDDFGNPLYVDGSLQRINYSASSFCTDDMVSQLLLYKKQALILTREKLQRIHDEKVESVHRFDGIFFEAKIINNILYVVERREKTNHFQFILYRTEDLKTYEKIDETILERPSSRSHEPFYAPLNYGEEDYPFDIGNSYGEIQEYGSSIYLHPGVDFLGDDYQDVYSVHDGVVKAVLTTGGGAYWRVAISNSFTPAESEGYLYAHLNYSSIPVIVGDAVSAGDFVGTLYPWASYDFTHIHFARIIDSGPQWDGDWWTTDNPLIDVINMQDSIPPTFENAFGSELFAFRTPEGTYLSSDFLTGEIDIIAKCHDIANSNWKIDVWDLRYSFHPIDEPDSTVYEQFAYEFDMELDTYGSGTYDWMVLNTIYSRDNTCYSIGNYEDRDYYHILTNSNGDSLITEDDAAEAFNTETLPNGDYILKVTARDASMNETSAEMSVTIYNPVNTIGKVESASPDYYSLSHNYPNPFNPVTTIGYQLAETTDVTISIYNSSGQLVENLLRKNQNAGYYTIKWDAKGVSSGVYFYEIKTKSGFSDTKKCVVLK